MQKTYLFTPGPTPVPPEVLAAMAEPMVHHRGTDFRQVYERCLTRLQEVCRTQSQVLLFAASGTGAMESAVANLCEPGQKVAVVDAGAFGSRWAAICDQYGLDVERVQYEWGEVPQADEVASAARAAGAEVVFCTQSETSTGVVIDVQAFKQAVGDGTLVVDAVSSLGAVPLETDAWGVDVVVSGSQKALMCPPGLAMATVAEHLWERLPASRSFYFDWKRARKAQEVFDAAFTPSVSLIRGLDVALGLLLEQGLEKAFERHVKLGRATRAGIKAMGLELFSPDDDSASVVTAVRCPDGVDGTAFLRHLRDEHGVTLAPGQGALKGKIFRIGHIGWFDVFDIAAARVRGLRGTRPGIALWPDPVERVAEAIRAAAVEATIEEFPDGTPTAESAARAIGCHVEEIVKTLVFVTERGYVLGLVPGDRRADPAKIAAASFAQAARVATRDEVPFATGFEAGGVAPFPNRGVVSVLLEQGLLQYERVWIGAGSDRHMASLAPADLIRLANALPADLVAPR